MTKPTHRAWVMVARNRGLSGEFWEVEARMFKLVEDDPLVFKKCIPVYGYYDIVMPVEHDSLQGLHKAVDIIQAQGGDSLVSTTTFVAAAPAFDKPDRFKEKTHQVCVGIITTLGMQDAVRCELERMESFDVTDVIFGEFDIIALFTKTDKRALTVLREVINGVPHIQNTTTMLPVTVGDE
jgi:hypothetical protein